MLLFLFKATSLWGDSMLNDTSLIRMVIDLLVQRNNWSYEDALRIFYSSNVCKGLSDENTGMFTFAPKEIVYLLERELESPTTK